MKNNKFFKKFAATFLAIAILLASAPLSGFAGLDFLDLFNISASAQEYSGTCGENLTWTFDEATGELKIEGTGDMYDYGWEYGIYSAPWRGCISRIKWVSVSHNVTSIGDYAFYNCTALTDIVLPDAATSIGECAFAGCTSLWDIRIPDDVIHIGDYAFCECWNLRSLIFEGSGITNIGYSAFEECYRLKEITIPDGVKQIGDYAFYNCQELTSVTIPDSVTSIGNSAFKHCYELASVTIPDSVTDIGDNAFFNCLNLESIKVYEENSAYSSDETGVLFNKEKSELIQYPIGNTRTDYSIPESVTKICESAFDRCTNLKNIIIPNSVICIEKNAFRECECNSIIIQEGITSIGDYAFLGCKATSISIPDSVTLIGESAFEECNCLEEIIIPDSVTSIGGSAFASCQKLTDITLPDKISGIASGMFYDCDNLINITLPDSVTSIGDYAFYNCTALTDIVISDAATSIGDYAFSWCESLTSITIPDSVTSIGDYAFDNCSLTDVYFGGTVAEWNNIAIGSNNEYLLKATIYFAEDETVLTGTCGENLTWSLDTSTGELVISGEGEMYDYSDSRKPWFEYRDLISKVTICEGVTSIGNYAFAHCSNLLYITIPEGVTSIGIGAFYYCMRLRSVEIPEGVTIIEDSAFAYCNSLAEVIIPYGVTRIEESAFSLCYALSNVNIPETVTIIDDYAFEWTALRVLNIPNGVISIGNSAFRCSTELEKIKIPDSVTSLDNSTFEDCPKLRSIDVSRGNNAYSSDSYGVLFNKDQTEIITYPEGSSETSYTIPDSVTKIGSCAFYSCYRLMRLIIPASVTIIDEYAFGGNDKLTDIYYKGSESDWKKINIKNYNEDLLNITIHFIEAGEELSFSGTCGENLTWTFFESTGELVIEGTGEMYDYITEKYPDFYHDPAPWYGLDYEKLTICNGVTSIGNDAFAGGFIIKEVTIPESVTSIGNYAFDGCSGLENITIPVSVKNIGLSAFYSCYELTDVYFSGTEAEWNKIEVKSGNSDLLNATIHFAEKETVVTGTCGENLTWSFDEETATLTIEGTGDMYDYVCEEINEFNHPVTPWYEQGLHWSINKIVIKDGVTSIGNNAFSCCICSTSISIPDSVTRIGDYAFNECLSIENFTIPDSMTYISNYMFSGCTKLANITIPDTVTNIGDAAFEGCTNLKNITIPESVTSINAGAFAFCSGLESVTIPDGVTSISRGLFGYCTRLKSVTIPGSVTSIGDHAFVYCTSLENVTIPDGVTTINNFVFLGCESLKDITIPERVTGIGQLAFSECASLKSIVIPEAVTWIGSNPFSYCTSLESIKVDEANTTYLSDENGVLFNKDKTKLIQYPNGNTITDYTIPDSVTQITDYAFRGSDYLTSITIPESIISLDLSAFDDCENLHTFYYNGSKTEWEKIDIKPGENHGGPVEIIFAEVELQESGKCGDNLNWYYYDNGELIIEGTGDMYDYVSDDYYVSGVEKSPWHELPFTKLIVRDGVTSLADEAFWFCDYLKSITIPESITSIDDYEFQACYELTTISIPASVTSIGSGAFGDCFNLTDVYYGGSEEEWSKISFKDSCYAIDYATIHFAESEHEHSYTSEITTQPTCTSEGVETFVCECGDSYTQAVPEKGHTLSHITVDSTCKVAGMEYDLCSECEEIFNSGTLPLAEHTWSEWTVTAEPTTENEGSKTRTCSVCSAEETESIPKLEVIKDEETGIEIVFGDEYGEGVEVQASEVYDGKSFQLVEANYGNVKTTIFDISTTVDGVAVQPAGKVKVRIPLPEGFGAGKVVVCYVDSENGKVTSIPAKVVDGYVEFETDHFSHYALLATKGKVNSVKIDDVNLNYKDTMVIRPEIYADDGVRYTVTYSSSKPSVADINQNGKITATAFGRTTITCTVTDEYGNTVTEKFTVNVRYTFWQWIIMLFLFGELWY